jgi:hypothetical protein
MHNTNLNHVLETCGHAVGFALAAALRSQAESSDKTNLKGVADNLQAMVKDARFSPDVSLVLTGLVEGIEVFCSTSPETNYELI